MAEHAAASSSSLDALMRPRSLAFVGVSAKGGAGAKMLRSAKAIGFDGALWPVNPRTAEIEGIPAHAGFDSLPGAPDCVVVAVPSDAVLGVLKDAVRRGARSALVVSEGFADAATDEGRARQAELVAFARSTGLAVAGPNCMGIASFGHRNAAMMADIPDGLPTGGISVVSQSGGLLNAVAELAGNRGIGLNYLISNGNGAVVEIADYIDWLSNDEKTRVIAVIMEGARDGRPFRAAVERAARLKPIVVLKLGRSAVGQQATLAHTGTLAGKHETFAALFRQNGVALVESLDELVETAALFDTAKLPAGGHVAMLTVSGGATSLIADLGETAGISFPPIAKASNDSLCRILDVERQFGNPIDTVGMPRLRKGDNMARVLETLLNDPGIDVIGLVLGMRSSGVETHEHLVNQMAARVAQSAKPLLVVSFIGNSLTRRWRGFAAESGLAIVEDLECGLRAVQHLVAYAQFRRRPSIRGPEAAERVPLGLVPEQTLTEAASKDILGRAGLPVTQEILARTVEEAAAAAARIGKPVAIKVQSPDIPHKSDVGGVHLGAVGPDDAGRAAERVLANARRACPDARIDGVLVQEMVEDGAEFILGMTYDAQFGPMIVLGAGGVLVEVFKDAAVGVPPLSRADVEAMIADLKISKMLDAFRGAPERDREALIDCILGFSKFVIETDGQIDAIDLNPVFVCAKGKGVRIADALIVTRSAKEEQ